MSALYALLALVGTLGLVSFWRAGGVDLSSTTDLTGAFLLIGLVFFGFNGLLIALS